MYGLISKYNAYVRSITGRVLMNRYQDIEECTADTFVLVWKKKESIDNGTGNIAINRYNPCLAVLLQFMQ